MSDSVERMESKEEDICEVCSRRLTLKSPRHIISTFDLKRHVSKFDCQVCRLEEGEEGGRYTMDSQKLCPEGGFRRTQRCSIDDSDTLMNWVQEYDNLWSRRMPPPRCPVALSHRIALYPEKEIREEGMLGDSQVSVRQRASGSSCEIMCFISSI